MATRRITVATAQVAGTAEIENNILSVERMAADAASRGADIVVFPEAVMYAFSATAAQIATAAREHGEQFEVRISRIAAEQSVAIVAGTYRADTSSLARNMLVECDAYGRWVAQYQKLHLYDAFEYKESQKSASAPLQPEFGELAVFECGGFKCGLLNCYDIRFPEMARALVERGAEILLVGSAWVAGPLKAFHWETLLKARAIENTCFVVAACQPAPASVGLSMIIDPNGVPQSAVPAGGTPAMASLEAARLESVREILPCLAHRRYGIHQKA